MIAIIPGIFWSYHRADRWIFDLADTHQLVVQDLGFCMGLVFMGDMLVMAAPTLSEMSALWLNALRRFFQHFDDFTPCEILFLLHQADTHPLPRQPERHEYSLTALFFQGIIQAAHYLAAVGEFLESKSSFFHGSSQAVNIPQVPQHGLKSFSQLLRFVSGDIVFVGENGEWDLMPADFYQA